MTEQFSIEVDGNEYDVEYVTHDCLSSGDYGGYGYYGAVNITCVENDHPENSCGGGMGYNGLRDAVESNSYVTDGKLILPTVVTLYGHYNSQECYMLAGDYADEILAALDNYPLLDESAVSDFECEALDEQYSDLMTEMLNAVESLAEDIECEATYCRVSEAIEALDDDTLDAMLRDANHGDLPIELDNSEYSPAWYITDVDDHAQAIVDVLTVDTDPSPIGCALRIRRDNLMADLFAA